MRRLLLILILVATEASAQFRITPEQPVAEPVPSPAEAWLSPVVASDGNGFMIFWSGPGGLKTAPVNADGTLMRKGEVAVVVPAALQGISACWTGSTYVVTWQRDDERGLYTAAFSREGALMSGPRLIATDAFTATGMLATNGRRVLAVYRATGSASPLVAILDREANVIAPAVSLSIAEQMTPFIVSDGNDFAVAWTTFVSSVPIAYDIHLQRIDETGKSIGDRIEVGRIETVEFRIASGGSRYAIVAMETHLVAPGRSQPRLARFVVDAKRGDAMKLPTLDASSNRSPSIFWNGSMFVAYWMTSSRSFVMNTVAFTGAPEAAPPSPGITTLSAREPSAPQFASNGGTTFGVWTEHASDSFVAISVASGGLFDANASALASGSTFVISTGLSRQFEPSIATSGEESLVVWEDRTTEFFRGRLLGARIARNGAVLDRTPFEIAPFASEAHVTFAAAAYLVVYKESTAENDTAGRPVARAVGRDGSVGPRMPIAGAYPAAASNATTTLLAFAFQNRIAAIRFNARGEQIDATPFFISGEIGGEGGWLSMLQVATNGSDFLVVWNVADFLAFRPVSDVFAARVTETGAVDTAPIPIATGKDTQILAAVGSDGRDYLVLYTLTKTDPGGPMVLAAKRVLREGQLDGSPSDDGTIVTRDQPSMVAIAHDERGYWIGWTRGFRNQAIVLVHTDARGNPGEPIMLSAFDADQHVASIALTQAGRVLQIAYARSVAETTRMFIRLAGDFANRVRSVGH